MFYSILATSLHFRQIGGERKITIYKNLRDKQRDGAIEYIYNSLFRFCYQL